MDYVKETWVAREGTGLNKFEKTAETANVVYLENVPDTITEAGTAFTTTRMNNIEDGIDEAVHFNGTPDEITEDYVLRAGWKYKTYGSLIIADGYSLTITDTSEFMIDYYDKDNLYADTGFVTAVEDIAESVCNPYTDQYADQAELDAVSTANSYTDTEVAKPQKVAASVHGDAVAGSAIYNALSPYMTLNQEYLASGQIYLSGALTRSSITKAVRTSGTVIKLYLYNHAAEATFTQDIASNTVQWTITLAI